MPTLVARRFDDWRTAARGLIASDIPPEEVHWLDGWEPSAALFPAAELASTTSATFTVPKEFLSLAKAVSCHRDPARWATLYRVLWRLTHGESSLLEVAVDPEVHQLARWEKSVRRDEHKMHAFVRFARTTVDGDERFIAWYRPDHHVVRLAAEFFVDRFRAMYWSILTPEECATWDGKNLQFGPGLPRSAAPQPDELVELWRSYYASTFNPARLNPAMMRREMPVRFWPQLPEAELIPDLIQAAAPRTGRMLAREEAPRVSAADFLPAERGYASLVAAAAACRGCDLHARATQTVFGEGPTDAPLMFVGEQPGDREDREGRPFIGPAGELFDQFLTEVGLDRNEAYVTNAVKHFKWRPHGKIRLHSKPGLREVVSCRAWLDAELNLVRPQLLVLLGATAAQSLFGRTFKLTERRGQPFASDFSSWTLATYHPSALLRAANEAEARELRGAFRHDLELAALQLRTLRKQN